MAQVKALIGNIKGKDGMANVYSTSETVIGTWNGSTLYRKMMQANIPMPTTNGTYVSSNFMSDVYGFSFSKVKNIYIYIY